MKIYLDTNLWNALCDRAVDPHKLVMSLDARNANLVIGLHNFYEFAKTFGKSTDETLERGKQLFSYLKQFVDVHTLCVKENDELLAAEMWALQLRSPTVDTFYDVKDYALIRQGIDRLAIGEFDERAAKFIEAQRGFASDIRFGQMRRLESRADAKELLKNVSPEEVQTWLEAETSGASGPENLKGHIMIMRRFPEATEADAKKYSSVLLGNPNSRFAAGLVRASSYYMWRCAYRDSVPGDLFDDIYHVLNSIHCDVYATEEKKQAEYAGLLLTAHTSVAIYDGKKPLDLWLRELA
jgi:hypothetical protein